MSNHEYKVGGNIPVLWMPSAKRMYGATVVTTNLKVGERVVAGTPFEHNLGAREAKFLKSWKIKAVNVTGTNTKVTLICTSLTPELRDNTMLMVMPSTLDGTGKAALCGIVTKSEENNTYEVTLATASFDALAVGGFLVESSATEAGDEKSLFCQPNNISPEDTIVGNAHTAIDIPYGVLGVYQTNIPAMPEVVKKAISEGDVKIIWENYNTNEE